MAIESMNNYQVFPKEYFSGSDVYISFANIPIDEIVTLQVVLQEPLVPIYGYGSYTYDAVARGGRIVTGAFRINFKESMYISSVMNKLFDEGVNSRNSKTTEGMSRDELLAWIKGRRISEIEQMAEASEANLWGVSGKAINKYGRPFFSERLSSDGSVYNPLLEYGFDIIIAYGNELLEIGKAYEELPGTVKTINGVHLTGVSQTIAPTGESIYEEYTFMARDLDNTLVKR